MITEELTEVTDETGELREEPEGDTFPRSYVLALREENKARRHAEKGLEEKVKEFENKMRVIASNVQALLAPGEPADADSIAERIAEAKSLLENERRRAQDALVRFAFSHAAKEAGIVHVEDAMKLADLSGVNVDLETGETSGLHEVIEDLLTNRSYLARRKSRVIGIEKPAGGIADEDGLLRLARRVGNRE
ncbi:MAG: hypothetical protein NUW37_20260 [Planctomycetes bacterium]|nr:hypothetical protein [Planctomycetota bacterium]